MAVPNRLCLHFRSRCCAYVAGLIACVGNAYLQEWAAAAGVAATLPAGKQPKRQQLWRFFWAAHQRFFRAMCMAAKVPILTLLTHCITSSCPGPTGRVF